MPATIEAPQKTEWFTPPEIIVAARTVLGDHIKAHAYVHFVGYRYVLYPEVIGGLGLVHPASATAMLLLGRRRHLRSFSRILVLDISAKATQHRHK